MSGQEHVIAPLQSIGNDPLMQVVTKKESRNPTLFNQLLSKFDVFPKSRGHIFNCDDALRESLGTLNR